SRVPLQQAPRPTGPSVFPYRAWKSAWPTRHPSTTSQLRRERQRPGHHRPRGYNELQSRYLGAYATWMTSSGLYVDSVLQGGSQRFTIRPDINLGAGGKASSVAASVEVGKPFALSARWSLEPQAQIAWQRTRIDVMLLSGAQFARTLATAGSGAWACASRAISPPVPDDWNRTLA
ncbi:autotransporter outer membrane beta-barrel domain-containing protein, partial [Variovorax rhizosphaerae]